MQRLYVDEQPECPHLRWAPASVAERLVPVRSERVSHRFYSVSSQIRTERRDYPRILERTHKGNADVTDWMGWSLGCFGRAIESRDHPGGGAHQGNVLAKGRGVSLNDRQRRVLNGPLDGFSGNLTNLQVGEAHQVLTPEFGGWYGVSPGQGVYARRVFPLHSVFGRRWWGVSGLGDGGFVPGAGVDSDSGEGPGL